MKEREFIVCSAILTTEQGKEILNGAEFLTGLRHHSIFRTFNNPPDYILADRNPRSQGFMTSMGRWVDRKEAAEIARRERQVREDHSGILFSEDLY